MPYSDEMLDDLELERAYDEFDGQIYRESEDQLSMRREDHDMGIFDGYDDGYKPHLRTFDSSFAKIAELEDKGITIPGDSFDGIIEIDEYRLYANHDEDLYEWFLELRDEPFLMIQERLIRKSEARQRQATKHKLWAPKKN